MNLGLFRRNKAPEDPTLVEKRKNKILREKIEKIEKLFKLSWWKNVWVTAKGSVLVLVSVPFFVLASKAMFWESTGPAISHNMEKMTVWFTSLNLDILLWEPVLYAGGGVLLFFTGISILGHKGRNIRINTENLKGVLTLTKETLISFERKVNALEEAERRVLETEKAKEEELARAKEEVTRLEAKLQHAYENIPAQTVEAMIRRVEEERKQRKLPPAEEYEQRELPPPPLPESETLIATPEDTHRAETLTTVIPSPTEEKPPEKKEDKKPWWKSLKDTMDGPRK
jgi:phage terminase Nu1 subunit (DNA packaging protein)